MLTRASWLAGLRPREITVNSVAPGVIPFGELERRGHALV